MEKERDSVRWGTFTSAASKSHLDPILRIKKKKKKTIPNARAGTHFPSPSIPLAGVIILRPGP